ncbi:head completion/stabilization protein [Erythrobacter sp. SG61-1L]|uniref:head completion/stabilization protein n=1 Tax=Erythrobacter sp. SG61-1L TaxID=1603897 RepID=UPI0006C8EF52|nr:head completion/stabilization protein [Erythrobacter sp. SG61-1L]
MPSDVISTPPLPASPDGSTIDAGEWWPTIDVNQVRDQVNIGGAIPHARLVEALQQGMISAIDELADWQAAQIAAGHADLGAVPPAVTVDGKPRRELLFLSAVCSFAAARLAERNPDLTATREGSDRADQRRDMADDLRREATHAIRQIMGKPRTNSELI